VCACVNMYMCILTTMFVSVSMAVRIFAYVPVLCVRVYT